jgi:WD40 repeat protein/serine/threonine protein kinase/tetratricopeptide (TPR) repeat protein
MERPVPPTIAAEQRGGPSPDSDPEFTHVIGPRGIEMVAEPDPRRARNAPLPKCEGYEIVGELGRGGMGVVYKARQTLLNRVVALKMILGGGLADEEMLVRFEREATSVARLQHPAIVQIFEVGVQRDSTGDGFACPFISLEFVEGGSLSQKIGCRPQPVRESARLVETLARAVHYAHEHGIVHRDLKPANVLLTADGAPKITDFGLAKDLDRLGPEAKTVSGMAMGTPEYMPPEQASGHSGEAGPAADIYGLGVILYEMLIGRPPFEGENALQTMARVVHEPPRPPRRLRGEIPRDLEVICLKCLEKEPGRRYRSAAALADDLARFQADEPIVARPPSVAGRFARWCRRKPLVAGMTSALVTVFLVGFAAVTALWLLADERGRLAEKKSQEASDALKGEAQARSDGQLHIARLDGATAGRLLDDGDLLAALPWLVEMMQLEEKGLSDKPEEKAERERIHRARLAAVLRECPRPLQIWTHERPLRTAFFSPDGRFVLTAAENQAVRAWDTESGAERWKLPAGRNDATRFAFGGKGVLAAGAASPTEIVFTDAASGATIGAALELNELFSHVDLSPDGRHLLVGSGHRATVWDVALRKKLWDGEPSRGTGKGISVARFAAGGRWVIIGNEGAAPEVRDASSGKVVTSLDGTAGMAVCSSADGRHVAVCGGGGVCLLDGTTGRERRTLAHGTDVGHAEFSADGHYLATAGDDGSARVWDVEKGTTPLATFRHAGRVVRVAFSPDGRRLLTASQDGTARLWGALTGRPLAPPLRHSRPLVAASFHPDGDRVLTAAEDGVARLWDVTDATHPARLLRHAAPVVSAAFDTNGQRVATAARDGTVRLWTAAGAAASPWMRQAERLMHVGFHPSDKVLITSGYLPAAQPIGIVQTWDLERAAPGDLRLSVYAGAVKSAEFSPDGSRVLLTAPFSANVWDRALSRDAVSINHGHRMLHAVFSPDGSRVGAASEGRFSIWDAAVGELFRSGDRPGQRDVNQVAFNHDATRLAVAGVDRTVQIVDAKTGAPIIPAMRHDDQVRCVAFSPDGKLLVSSGNDRTVRLWDAQSGQPLMLPLPHRGPVISATFSVDGKKLLTLCNVATDAGVEGQVRWWDVATGEPLTPPLAHPGEVHQAACSRDGLVVTACENGAAWVWPAPEPGNWSLDDLRRLAEVACGQRLDARHGPLPLAPTDLAEAWNHLRSQHADHFGRSVARVDAWRRYEAEECEATKQWSAAAWFLDRLSAEQPADWELAARRAHVDHAAGSPELAEKKLSTALKLGPPAATRPWLKARADLAAAGEQWATAKWYLDRMLTEQPADAAAHAQRAFVRGRLGDANGHTADLEKAVALGAGGGVVMQLAQLRASEGDWSQAAQLYGLAADRGAPSGMALALASIRAGNQARYRQACKAALAAASADSALLEQANQAAWLCALAPGAVDNYTAAIKLAETAVAGAPPEIRAGYLNTLGAVLYRAGRYREAIDRLREGMKLSHSGPSGEDWVFLGLAHLSLGETDEAKRCLEKFRSTPSSPGGDPFWQRIEYDLLREQLESAIGRTPTASKK